MSEPATRDAGAPDHDENNAPGAQTDVWRDRKWIAGTVGLVLVLVGLFFVAMWLYAVLAHFLFLLLMAWLFAAAKPRF